MAKLLSVNTLDVLEARGSTLDRGYAYGVRYKPLIRRLIDSHYDFYARHLQTSRENALRERVRTVYSLTEIQRSKTSLYVLINWGQNPLPRTMKHTQIRDRAYIEGYSLYSQVL